MELGNKWPFKKLLDKYSILQELFMLGIYEEAIIRYPNTCFKSLKKKDKIKQLKNRATNKYFIEFRIEDN